MDINTNPEIDGFDKNGGLIELRIKALGMTAVEVAEGCCCCEGCENEPMLRHDATCYLACEDFAAEVAAMEQP